MPASLGALVGGNRETGEPRFFGSLEAWFTRQTRENSLYSLLPILLLLEDGGLFILQMKAHAVAQMHQTQNFCL